MLEMANGDYLPNCPNCNHFSIDSDYRCKLHQVVLPSLGTETICADWTASEGLAYDSRYAGQVEKFLKNAAFLSLKKGVLYYDASYAQTPVRLFYAELGPFKSLLKTVGAWISHDDQYDWILLLEPYTRGDQE